MIENAVRPLARERNFSLWAGQGYRGIVVVEQTLLIMLCKSIEPPRDNLDINTILSVSNGQLLNSLIDQNLVEAEPEIPFH